MKKRNTLNSSSIDNVQCQHLQCLHILIDNAREKELPENYSNYGFSETIIRETVDKIRQIYLLKQIDKLILAGLLEEE